MEHFLEKNKKQLLWEQENTKVYPILFSDTTGQNWYLLGNCPISPIPAGTLVDDGFPVFPFGGICDRFLEDITSWFLDQISSKSIPKYQEKGIQQQSLI